VLAEAPAAVQSVGNHILFVASSNDNSSSSSSNNKQ
jgi:hypothetical protein